MQEYYSIMFLVLMFAQEHMKGVLATLVCFIVVTTNTWVTIYIESLGYTYYEAYMFYEAIVFSFSIFILNHKIGVVLCIVSFIAFTLNTGGYLLPETKFYRWYYEHYKLVNGLLLESLIVVCITSSKIRPVLNKLNDKLLNLKGKSETKCG